MPFVPFSQQRSTTQQQPIGFVPNSRTSTSGVGAIVNSSMNGGNPQKTFGSPPQAPNVVITGRNGIVNLPGVAAEAKTEKTANLTAQSEFESQRNKALLDSLQFFGKPIEQLTYDEMLKATGGNVDLANALKTGSKAAKAGDKESTFNTAIVALKGLINFAKQIPSGETGFKSKYITGGVNAFNAKMGYLPEKELFDANAELAGPLLVLGLGQDRVSETDAKSINKAIVMLAAPTKKLREEQVQYLQSIIKDKTGKGIKLSGENLPPAMKVNQQKQELEKLSDKYDQMTTEELLKLL
jgi:hypothetical protein